MTAQDHQETPTTAAERRPRSYTPTTAAGLALYQSLQARQSRSAAPISTLPLKGWPFLDAILAIEAEAAVRAKAEVTELRAAARAATEPEPNVMDRIDGSAADSLRRVLAIYDAESPGGWTPKGWGAFSVAVQDWFLVHARTALNVLEGASE